MVEGIKIPFSDISQLPNSRNAKNQVPGHLWQDMDKEIGKLLSMGVIEPSVHEAEEVISPIFFVEISDGSYRIILNLKEFNKSVEYEHFKMENLPVATNMTRKGCYMASIDLRHAYYSVSVHPEFRTFLKLKWKQQLYNYTCLPHDLANAPLYFTKLLKPVYAFLRAQGFLSASFIDDSYLQGRTIRECEENVEVSV